ncbi:MAG: peroxidase-related enzyme [Anaerolineales bacterium]|jgi:uncharacterized peroxidase-related enzyme
MTWIKTTPFEEASGKLKTFYKDDFDRNGFLQNIYQALSLRSESLIALAELRKTFAGENSLLGPRKEELIHTVVSVMNRCRHCTNSHAKKLKKITGPIAGQVKNDWRRADLNQEEIAMLDFCEKVTLNRQGLCNRDIELLRESGFSDCEILEIVLHVAYRHFMNIVADSLGVEDEPL